MKMYGWCGKILQIDLGSKQYRVETPEVDIYHCFIGGKGLTGYYLRKNVTLPWKDSAMPLLFPWTVPLVLVLRHPVN
jgi:aldehyde:ferredoxin oxidoreductase